MTNQFNLGSYMHICYFSLLSIDIMLRYMMIVMNVITLHLFCFNIHCHCSCFYKWWFQCFFLCSSSGNGVFVLYPYNIFVLDSINILPCVIHSELNSNIININNLFISYCQRLVQIMTQSLAIHCFALLCCIVNMKCFVHCCQAQRNMWIGSDSIFASVCLRLTNNFSNFVVTHWMQHKALHHYLNQD